MEVRPGYKQAEVGVIPEEWASASLSVFADVKTGPFGSALHESDYVNDGTPIITVEHLGERGVVHENLPYVSDADWNRLRIYSLQPGDIVFSRVGSVDRNALIRDAEDGWLFSGRLLRVRTRKGNVYPPYLSFYFHSEPFKHRVRAVAVGQTMASLNTQILNGLHVVLPALPEQRAIAMALSDVDALLGGLERLVAKKRELQQAAMQQLLTGETRLPGFLGEWEVKTLGDLGSTFGGLMGKTRADFGNGAGNYVTFMNVMTKVVIHDGSFDRVKISPTESQNRVLNGDLLFTGSSETPEEIAMCAVLMVDVPNLFLNSFCFGFRLRDRAEADGLFLAYYLRSRVGREVVKSLAQGSTRYNVSKGALLRAALRLPPPPEQTAIATVLSDLDTELAALDARCHKIRDLKQAMMQDLLTGKTRLLPEGATHA